MEKLLSVVLKAKMYLEGQKMKEYSKKLLYELIDFLNTFILYFNNFSIFFKFLAFKTTVGDFSIQIGLLGSIKVAFEF